MSEAKQFCLLVSRAGSTKICPLPSDGLRFGYSPPSTHDLTLYDGALQDVHGTIEYDATIKNTNNTDRPGTPTQFRLRAHAAGIVVDKEALPVREAIAIQLWTGNQIQVGNKYILTIAEYQPESHTNGSALALPDLAAVNREPRAGATPYAGEIPPFLTDSSTLFLPHLPEIYHAHPVRAHEQPPFLARFLALFESVVWPTIWTVENFDLFLHPDSAPPEFLPWLAGWYGLPFDTRLLSVSQQREILRHIPDLIARKGTIAGLTELLYLYIGEKFTIEETGHAFSVAGVNVAHLDRGENDPALIAQFIVHQRPLSKDARIVLVQTNQQWELIDSTQRYMLHRNASLIDVYVNTVHFVLRFTAPLADNTLLAAAMVQQIRLLIDLYKPLHTDYTITDEKRA